MSPRYATAYTEPLKFGAAIGSGATTSASAAPPTAVTAVAIPTIRIRRTAALAPIRLLSTRHANRLLSDRPTAPFRQIADIYGRIGQYRFGCRRSARLPWSRPVNAPPRGDPRGGAEIPPFGGGQAVTVKVLLIPVNELIRPPTFFASPWCTIR